MLRRILYAAALTGAAVALSTAIKMVQNPGEKKETEPKKPVIDPEELQEPEAEISPEVLEIAEIYPYLDIDFVEEQFRRNDTFNEMYPVGTTVTICHKVKFEALEVKVEFMRIAAENGYDSNILNPEEVIVMKKVVTENGMILSNIYNVANQVKCLNGVYEGYSIEQ